VQRAVRQECAIAEPVHGRCDRTSARRGREDGRGISRPLLDRTDLQFLACGARPSAGCGTSRREACPAVACARPATHGSRRARSPEWYRRCAAPEHAAVREEIYRPVTAAASPLPVPAGHDQPQVRPHAGRRRLGVEPRRAGPAYSPATGLASGTAHLGGPVVGSAHQRVTGPHCVQLMKGRRTGDRQGRQLGTQSSRRRSPAHRHLGSSARCSRAISNPPTRIAGRRTEIARWPAAAPAHEPACDPRHCSGPPRSLDVATQVATVVEPVSCASGRRRAGTDPCTRPVITIGGRYAAPCRSRRDRHAGMGVGRVTPGAGGLAPGPDVSRTRSPPDPEAPSSETMHGPTGWRAAGEP